MVALNYELLLDKKDDNFFLSMGSDVSPPIPSKSLSSRNMGLTQSSIFYHFQVLQL